MIIKTKVSEPGSSILLMTNQPLTPLMVDIQETKKCDYRISSTIDKQRNTGLVQTQQLML